MVRRGDELKRWIMAGFLVILTLGLLSYGQASAANWAAIPPEEIVERVDLVQSEGETFVFFMEETDEMQDHNKVESVPATAGNSDASEETEIGRWWLVLLFVLSGSTVLLFGYRIIKMRARE